MSLTRQILFASIVLCVTLPALGTSSYAQPAPTDPVKRRIAKGYVDAGVAAQDAGDYATALELFAKAYSLVPHPVLLFNQGQAHRLAGHREDAKAFYREFLATTPKGEEAVTAKSWLATLEAEDARQVELARQQAAREEVARQAEAEAARQAEAEATRQAEAEATRREEMARRAAAHAAGQDADRLEAVQLNPVATEPSRQIDGGAGLRAAGLVAAAVGVAVFGAGVYFGLRASAISEDISAHNWQYDPSVVEDGQRAERNMYITYGVGAVLLSGGAALYILGRRKHSQSTVVAVAPRGDGAVFAVVGKLP